MCATPSVLAHVVRCFDSPDVPHIANKVSPADDIEMIHMELALADLETVDKRAEKLQKELKDPARKKEAERELAAYAKVRPLLQEGRPGQGPPSSISRRPRRSSAPSSSP